MNLPPVQHLRTRYSPAAAPRSSLTWAQATGIHLPAKHLLPRPAAELWGQLIRPLTIKSTGKNTMLGIRLFPHAAASILNDKVSLFNNQVTSFSDIYGKTVRTLHNQLLEAHSWNKRIAMVEAFLLQHISLAAKRLPKINVINDLMYELRQQHHSGNNGNNGFPVWYYGPVHAAAVFTIYRPHARNYTAR